MPSGRGPDLDGKNGECARFVCDLQEIPKRGEASAFRCWAASTAHIIIDLGPRLRRFGHALDGSQLASVEISQIRTNKHELEEGSSKGECTLCINVVDF